MSRLSSPMPADLSKAAGEFAEWRSRRTGRRIPAELWSRAAALAARHGISRTARALHVRYYDLKKRVESSPADEVSRFISPGPRDFVEILTGASPSASEVTIELERACGSKMRIHLKGAGPSVLADLSRTFLESRS